jgi:small ligand-binding sensory domain FIST
MARMNIPNAFRYACIEGSDPRQLAQQLCADLAIVPAEGADTFGLVYVSEALARHSVELIQHLRTDTGVQRWVGCTGLALLGGKAEYYESPAVVAMVGSVPRGTVHMLPSPVDSFAGLTAALKDFLTPEEPGSLILHADPHFSGLEDLLAAIDQKTAWYVTGGVASGQTLTRHFASEVLEGGVSGLVLKASVPLAIRHTQGCSPLPGQHRLSETWRNIMVRLDDKPALQVFKTAIGEILSRDLRRALGYIHIGLPISGSDTADYRVRNILGIDLDRELLAVGEMLTPGEHVLFVRRDAQAAREDLLRMLAEIRRRSPQGIRGALYVSCLGRGRHQFGAEGHEIGIVQDALGDVPLVGFFANGEIFSNRLYGYTGVLTLFTD